MFNKIDNFGPSLLLKDFNLIIGTIWNITGKTRNLVNFGENWGRNGSTSIKKLFLSLLILSKVF